MTNPIHLWLEGKKKAEVVVAYIQGTTTPDPDESVLLKENVGYNQALADFQAEIPSLLSAMEAEIRKHILGQAVFDVDKIHLEVLEDGLSPEFFAICNDVLEKAKGQFKLLLIEKLSDIALEE